MRGMCVCGLHSGRRRMWTQGKVAEQAIERASESARRRPRAHTVALKPKRDSETPPPLFTNTQRPKHPDVETDSSVGVQPVCPFALMTFTVEGDAREGEHILFCTGFQCDAL